MILRFLLLLICCCNYVFCQSVQNSFLIQDSPIYSVDNPAFKYVEGKKLHVQLLYENRFNKKTLSIKSLGIGSSRNTFSWNSVFLHTGNSAYSESLLYLNTSIQLNSKLRLGLGVNVENIRSRFKVINQFIVYPTLGVAVKVREDNTFFSSFKFQMNEVHNELFHVASYEHYFQPDFSYRLQSNWSFKDEPEVVLVLKYRSAKKQNFYLGLSSSSSPFSLGYDFKWKKVRFVLSFWYHLRLGNSNQLGTSVSL